MTRITVFEDGGTPGAGRIAGLTPGDWLLVALIAGVSTVASVAAAWFSAGPVPEALVPGFVIPLMVSVPASMFLMLQRRRIADLNRTMLDLLRIDPLTGCLTRRFFLAGVEGGAPAAGGALLLIDADRFKAINDTHGHPAGDAVLAAIGRRLRRTAPPDVLIGRLGGEEFAAFAPGRCAESGAALGDDLRHAIRDEPVWHDGRQIPCTVSVGLAVLSPGSPLAQAIRAADEALYRAKALGRDRLERAGALPAGADRAALAAPA